MPRQSVVTAIPVDVLWDPTGRVLDADRVGYLGADEIRERLRSGDVQLLIADIGSELVRVEGREAFALWKTELSPRLVPPEEFESGIDSGDYPDQYCYVASRWTGSDLQRPMILFERYH